LVVLPLSIFKDTTPLLAPYLVLCALRLVLGFADTTTSFYITDARQHDRYFTTELQVLQLVQHETSWNLLSPISSPFSMRISDAHKWNHEIGVY
jgi:hypothetical protein